MAGEFPLPSFHFDVTIKGTEIGFQEVQGIGADIEYEEVRDLANASHTNRTFKRMKYKNLILKKGVFKNGMNAIKQVAEIFYLDGNTRRQVTVEPTTIVVNLNNEKGDAVIRWTLKNCIPIKYEFGGLNSMESKILVETMEFQYHSLKTDIL